MISGGMCMGLWAILTILQLNYGYLHNYNLDAMHLYSYTAMGELWWGVRDRTDNVNG